MTTHIQLRNHSVVIPLIPLSHTHPPPLPCHIVTSFLLHLAGLVQSHNCKLWRKLVNDIKILKICKCKMTQNREYRHQPKDPPTDRPTHYLLREQVLFSGEQTSKQLHSFFRFLLTNFHSALEQQYPAPCGCESQNFEF